MHFHIYKYPLKQHSPKHQTIPKKPNMKKSLVISLLPLFLSLTQGSLSPDCDIPHDHQGSSNIQIMHASHPCSPFTPKTPLPLEHTLHQMHSNDKTRFRFLSSLATGRPTAPIAYGSSIIQTPTYIVRASIGTPGQTLLMSIDTSSNAAWIPCTGCVGCSSTTFDSAKSSTFKAVPCGAPQCNQVYNHNL